MSHYIRVRRVFFTSFFCFLCCMDMSMTTKRRLCLSSAVGRLLVSIRRFFVESLPQLDWEVYDPFVDGMLHTWMSSLGLVW